MKTIVWFGLVLGALSASGKVFFGRVGRKVTLECGVNAIQNTLVWQRSGDRIVSTEVKSGFNRKGSSDIAGRSSVRQNTQLEVSRLTEADAGKFTCVGDGSVREHTLLVVSVSVLPLGALRLGSEATLQCRVKGLDSGPTLQWTRPDGSSLAGSQPVQLKPVAGSHAGIWKCTVTYEGEEFSETLTITVEDPAPKTTTPPDSQNSEDSRKPTCVNCDTNRRPSDPVKLLGLSWWVWLALGGGCLLVILLMLFVIVLCMRVRRSKRRFQRMKNGQLPLKPKKYCQCDCPTAAARPQQGRRREKP